MHYSVRAVVRKGLGVGQALQQPNLLGVVSQLRFVLHLRFNRLALLSACREHPGFSDVGCHDQCGAASGGRLSSTATVAEASWAPAA